MLFVLLMGFVLLGFGLLNLTFAFIPAPPALEPLLGATGRRLRFVISLFPEAQQQKMGRLLGGATLAIGGCGAIIAAVTRLFLS